MNHFFAYLSRMKFINRWSLMRNTHSENIQEHSHQVAIIAHALAVIKNRLFKGNLDAEHIAVLALYHDVSEVITGDLPSPIKYFNPEINTAYKSIEIVASKKLSNMLPEELKESYNSLLFIDNIDEENWKVVKVADKICSYLKCIEEIKAGNSEFIKAEISLKAEINKLNMPEVVYFMDIFVPSFSLTLDELN